jgi:hypothetical protein
MRLSFIMNLGHKEIRITSHSPKLSGLKHMKLAREMHLWFIISSQIILYSRAKVSKARQKQARARWTQKGKMNYCQSRILMTGKP